MEPRNSPTSQNSPENMGDISFPNFNLCYKAIVAKSAWYWDKDKFSNLCVSIESPHVNPRCIDS